jgi:hypothetical protein
VVKRLSPAFELPRELTLGLIAISTEYFGPTHRGHFRMTLTASGCIVRTLNGSSLNCRGATDRRILRQLPRLRRIHRPVRIRSAFGDSLRRRLRRPACALRSRPPVRDDRQYTDVRLHKFPFLALPRVGGQAQVLSKLGRPLFHGVTANANELCCF